jgi:hypothetical protein
VLNWPGVTNLNRHDGIGYRRGGPSADIEVTSPCGGQRSRLPMSQHRSKQRGSADGQAVRLAFDQHSYRPLSRCHAGAIPTCEDIGGQRACPRRCIGDPNLVDRCIGSDASVWLRRTAGACETGMLVWSDAFGCARTRCIGPLEMP